MGEPVPGMPPEDKNRFDALESLRKACYESLKDRRDFEWKWCFSLWTALVLFVGALVTQPDSPSSVLQTPGLPYAAGLVLLAIGLVHAYWIHGVGRANRIDRLYAYEVYEKEMRRMIGGLPLPPELHQSVTAARRKMGKLTNYSHILQIGITFILLVAASMLVWTRART